METYAYRLNGALEIVSASEESHPVMHNAIGRNVCDAFPGLDEWLLPLIDQAKASGAATGSIFYAGSVASMVVHREDDDTFAVYARAIPATGLLDSVKRAQEWLEGTLEASSGCAA